MNETAPIIITAQLGPADQAWANALRREHFPAERNYLDAHITLFHHLPPASLPEIKARLAASCLLYPAPNARLEAPFLLGRGVAFAIHCPELLAIRDELAAAFTGLLTPQDQARPKLHITVQNKVAPPVAKALCNTLALAFAPRPLAIIGMSAYFYRGGPWDLIKSYSFRG